jgi:hypothetical protein
VLRESSGPEFSAATEQFKTVHGHTIVTFNDTPGRTQAEVVAALRAAAEAA